MGKMGWGLSLDGNGNGMGMGMKSLRWEGIGTKICSRTALLLSEQLCKRTAKFLHKLHAHCG